MITSWQEVSIDTYAELAKAAALTDEVDRAVAIIAALTGKTADEVCDEPLPQFQKEKAAGAFVLTDIPAGRLLRHYDCGGFRFVPALDINKWSAIQYIDYNTIAKRSDFLTPVLLSCLLIPEGKTYGNGYDIGAAQRAIGAQLDIVSANAVMVAFLGALLNLTAAGLRSWDLVGHSKATRKTARAARRALRLLRRSLISGSGCAALTLWPQPLGEIGAQ